MEFPILPLTEEDLEVSFLFEFIYFSLQPRIERDVTFIHKIEKISSACSQFRWGLAVRIVNSFPKSFQMIQIFVYPNRISVGVIVFELNHGEQM